jgi:hypothetical protein
LKKLRAAFELENDLEGFKREMQQSNEQSFQMKSKPSGYLHTLMQEENQGITAIE